MGRWSQYDEDDYRLPEGMTRVGYDADTQRYSYRDSSGAYYEGPEGSSYGPLRPVGGYDQPASPEEAEAADHAIKEAKKQDMQHFLPFLLLVITFLLAVFYISDGRLTPSKGSAGQAETGRQCGDQASYQVQQGDTCWAIAEEHRLSLDMLERTNAGIDCEALQVGGMICIPDEEEGH